MLIPESLMHRVIDGKLVKAPQPTFYMRFIKVVDANRLAGRDLGLTIYHNSLYKEDDVRKVLNDQAP